MYIRKFYLSFICLYCTLPVENRKFRESIELNANEGKHLDEKWKVFLNSRKYSVCLKLFGKISLQKEKICSV